MTRGNPFRSRAARIALLPLLALLALWIWVKLGLFFGFEYTSDLFVHTQKSRSFLYGLPLLYDNFHGPHPYHNTFLELLFAPFTAFFGSLGLLVPALLLLGASWLAVLRWADRLQPDVRARVITFLFAGLMGPVGFWMQDNPVYGWHPEMLAFPLALLLAVGLVSDSTPMVRLSCAGLLLSHELGAVICGCILLLHYQIVRAPREKSWLDMLRRQITIVLPWMALFFAGLVLQRYWDAAGAQRLDGVLRVLADGSGLADIATMLGRLLVLLGTCGLVFFLFPLRFKAMIATLVCCAPLIAATTAASLAYTPYPNTDMHNVFWPPRFAFTWGILAAGVLISYSTVTREQPSRRIWLAMVPFALLVVAAQEHALVRIRSYSAADRIARVVNGLTYSSSYTDEEKRLLACIEGRMSPRVPVYLNGLLWAAFHNHDIDPFRDDNPHRRRPEIIICETLGRDPFHANCGEKQDTLLADTRLLRMRGLAIRYVEGQLDTIASCVLPKERP